MKLWQCKCGNEIEASSQVESHEIICPACSRVGKVMQLCPVCEEIITADESDGEETCECDPCGQEVHVECGGFSVAYGIDTWACENCRKHD